MLTTLRNHSQSWLIKLLLGLIVVTFVISFGIGTFTSSKEVLVRLDNEEILVRDYHRQYQESLDRLRDRYPENAEKIAEQMNLRQQVFDQMINRRVLLAEADRQGFLTSTEELEKAIKSESAFLVGGRFDFATYQAVLSQNDLTPEVFEYRMREDLLLRKYQRSLLAGVVVSKDEVEQRFLMENEEVEVDYVFVDPSRFVSQVQVTEEEEKSYYEAHQNEFMRPVQYRLRYFRLTLDDLLAGVTLPRKATRRYYERHKDEEFSTPPQVRASHILKRVDPNLSGEEKGALRKEMEAVLAEARGGADFAELARKYSEDLTADKGGDLGFFKPGDMVSVFDTAAFALRTGEISGIVDSPFGMHIILVTDERPGEERSFEDVAEEIAAQLRERRAERKLELEANRLPQKIQQKGIEAVAAEFSAKLSETGWFDRQSTLAGLGSADPLHDRLRTLESGNSGVWRRNPVQGHVFFQVLGKKEAFPKPLETVRDAVRIKLVNRKSRQLAAEAARAAHGELSAAGDLGRYASREGLSVKTSRFNSRAGTVPGIGVNPDFQQTAFRLTEEIPFGLSEAGGQNYLLRLKGRALPDAIEPDSVKNELRRRLKTEWEAYFMQKEYDRLKAQIEIEIVAPEYLAGI